MSIRIAPGDEPEVPRKFRGRWYRSGKPEEAVSGTLDIGTDALPSLDVNGTLRPTDGHHAKVILGLAHDGTKLSLSSAYFRSQRMAHYLDDDRANPPPVAWEEWQCLAVAIGAHVEDGTDTRVRELRFRSKMLEEWTTELRPAFERDRRRRTVGGIVKLPETVSVSVPLGLLHLEWDIGGSVETEVGADYRIYPELRIEFAEPITIEASWDSVVVPLLQMLTLFVGAGDWIQSLRYTPGGAQEEHYSSGRDLFGAPLWGGQFQWVTSSWMARSRSRVNLNTWEHVVQAKDAVGRLAEMVPAWFEVQRTLSGALLDYFSIQMWPEMTVNERFYRVVRALEVVHGALDPSPRISKTEFKAVKRSVMAALETSPHKDFIMARLSHADMPSLRERLISLFLQAGPRLRSRLPGSVENFVRDVVRTRDAMTHTGTGGPLESTLDRSFRLLDLLMRQILLIQIGFSPEEADVCVLRARDARATAYPPSRETRQ